MNFKKFALPAVFVSLVGFPFFAVSLSIYEASQRKRCDEAASKLAVMEGVSTGSVQNILIEGECMIQMPPQLHWEGMELKRTEMRLLSAEQVNQQWDARSRNRAHGSAP